MQGYLPSNSVSVGATIYTYLPEFDGMQRKDEKKKSTELLVVSETCKLIWQFRQTAVQVYSQQSVNCLQPSKVLSYSQHDHCSSFRLKLSVTSLDNRLLQE
jgi:hypothetical protein